MRHASGCPLHFDKNLSRTYRPGELFVARSAEKRQIPDDKSANMPGGFTHNLAKTVYYTNFF